jgi:hypothetical protein
MNMKCFVCKKIVIMLIVFSILFTSGMTFAYWASSIIGNSDETGNTIPIGQFPFGDPISTVEEFITLVTTDEITGYYYLANDINFNNIQPASWISHSDIRFKGHLDGNGKTLENITLTDRRAIFGVLDSGSIKNLNVVSASITYTTSGSTTAGVLIGRIQGNGALVENINISNSSVNSGVLSGGLVGIIQPLAGDPVGSTTLKNITITNTTITGALGNADYGNGGLVGSINNFNVTIEDVNLSTTVTATGASNSGGVVGAVLGTSTLSITNAVVSNSTVQINGTGTTLGAGGIVGKIQSSGHSFSKVRVFDSTISSASASGGIIGFATQASGTASINNAKVKGSTISSSIANATVGTGGIIGNNLSYVWTLNDLYVESNINTNNANVGGIIGYNTGANVINRAVVFSDVVLNNPTNTTDRGAGGVVGRSTVAMTATDVFFTGYLKARIASSQPYIGTLRAIGTNLTFTNSRSAEIRYFVSASNPNQLVNTATLYNNMRGQKAAYASTYTQLRSSLNVAYWTGNYSNITNSSLWAYNSTTNLYELND